MLRWGWGRERLAAAPGEKEQRGYTGLPRTGTRAFLPSLGMSLQSGPRRGVGGVERLDRELGQRDVAGGPERGHCAEQRQFPAVTCEHEAVQQYGVELGPVALWRRQLDRRIPAELLVERLYLRVAAHRRVPPQTLDRKSVV